GDRPERGADGHAFLHPDVTAVFSILPFVYRGNTSNKNESLKAKCILYLSRQMASNFDPEFLREVVQRYLQER
ncbi:MAG TPA: hypothetical protein PL086_11455, partial [Candidatus Aminicenantes bacterium]|nr:hypothetical protein [Candidatus Aminicenantes bacterium]